MLAMKSTPVRVHSQRGFASAISKDHAIIYYGGHEVGNVKFTPNAYSCDWKREMVDSVVFVMSDGYGEGSNAQQSIVAEDSYAEDEWVDMDINMKFEDFDALEQF